MQRHSLSSDNEQSLRTEIDGLQMTDLTDAAIRQKSSTREILKQGIEYHVEGETGGQSLYWRIILAMSSKNTIEMMGVVVKDRR